MKHIWYCSYGSNLLYKRFKLYILGGTEKFIDKIYQGCSDKTLPSGDEGYLIPYELYFAGKFSFWNNGGAAFISSEKSENFKTLSRIYKIKTEQFIEIVQQENGQKPNLSELDFNFERLVEDGSLSLGSEDEFLNYGKVLLVGYKDKDPVVTFTTKRNMEHAEFNKPSVNYLSTLIQGIDESFSLNDSELLNYFINRKGIKNQFSESELIHLIKKSRDVYETTS